MVRAGTIARRARGSPHCAGTSSRCGTMCLPPTPRMTLIHRCVVKGRDRGKRDDVATPNWRRGADPPECVRILDTGGSLPAFHRGLLPLVAELRALHRRATRNEPRL